jgi:hypothetical protein
MDKKKARLGFLLIFLFQIVLFFAIDLLKTNSIVIF